MPSTCNFCCISFLLEFKFFVYIPSTYTLCKLKFMVISNVPNVMMNKVACAIPRYCVIKSNDHAAEALLTAKKEG